jgi:hypothetical protein
MLMASSPRTHRAMSRRTPHPELIDQDLVYEGAQRLGRAGRALFEYYIGLEVLRGASDDLGHDALVARAARAEAHVRVLTSAGLDALNELYDLGLIEQSIQAATQDPDLISAAKLGEAIRHAIPILKRRFPDHEWDWLERAGGLIGNVNIRIESKAGHARATVTQDKNETAVSLRPEARLRIDTRAFFSAGPERVYVPTFATFSRTDEPAGGASPYDEAITALAFLREWGYRHARNVADLGAPARHGAGPGLIVAAIAIGIALLVISTILHNECEKHHDKAECTWADITSLGGWLLLAAAGGGSAAKRGGKDPSLQFGTNAQ